MPLKGAKAHSARLQRMRTNGPAAARAGLVKVAGMIEDDAKASIMHGSAGQPSAPGQAPNNQTGALVNGITSGPTDTGAHVTSADPASASLEFGRATARERPFLRPAVQKNLGNVAKEVAEEVRITLRRK